jgi:hypothetical protein
VLLANGAIVRLLTWQQGALDEPAESLFELELGDWRPYEAYAAPNPARAQQTVTHTDRFDRRVDRQRDRLFELAGSEVGARIEGLGWGQVVICAEAGIRERLVAALPEAVSHRLIGHLDLNLVEHAPAAIGSHLEPLVEEAWEARARGLVSEAARRALAGDAAVVIGPDAAFHALTRRRVAHLILDPLDDFLAQAATESGASLLASAAPAMLAERAVEAAIATGAQVTCLPSERSPELVEAGGAVALLYY